ncbi:MAG: hypothetical protein AAFY21_20695, partial [Cyanobacteria bacterium J06641_2]
CNDDNHDVGEVIEAFIENEYAQAFGPILLVGYGSATYEGTFYPPDGMLPAGQHILIVDIPCNSHEIKYKFDVLLTEIDSGDATLPEVHMRAVTQSGVSASVNTIDATGATINAFLGETIRVTTEARDSQGLKAVIVKAIGARIRPQATFNASGLPPIPIRKTLNVTVSNLPRSSPFVIEAIARNFNSFSNTVQTPQIIVNVNQRTPFLDSLKVRGRNSNRATISDEIDFLGRYFEVPGEPTVVRFEQDGRIINEVVVSSSDLQSNQIQVDIPRLSDGTYQVSVVVGDAQLSSNSKILEIFTLQTAPPERRTIKHSLILKKQGQSGLYGPASYRADVNNFSNIGLNLTYPIIRDFRINAGVGGLLARAS